MTAWQGYFGYPLSLVDADTGETLIIQSPAGADYPLAVQSFQVAGADVRAAVVNAPFRPGTIDSTKYGGAAAVTMNLTALPPNAHQTVDVLRAWINPARRTYLTALRTGWTATRRLLVRGDALTAPTVTATSDGPMVAMQMGFRAIAGVWESADENSRTIFPGGTQSGGLAFPAAFPWAFGTGSPAGVSLITVGGTAPTPPIIRIYGPVTAPGITNTTTGQTMQFVSSYTVPAGQYVSIDCDAVTVLANDDPTLTRMNSVDWSQSTFWQLQPGGNQVAFTGSGLSQITQTVISWRERTI